MAVTVQSRAPRRSSSTESESEWLSLQVAALRLNLSVDAVRRRLKRGELRGRRVRGVRGQRWEVQLGAPDEASFEQEVERGVDSDKWAQLMRELLSENAELGRQVTRMN